MPVASAMESLRFVRDRIEAILKAPGMWTWGPPAAVELQLLQLLETAHVCAGSDRETARAVPDRYWAHIGTIVPSSSLSLAAGLGLGNEASDQFVSVLRDFVTSEWRLMHRGHVEQITLIRPLRDAVGRLHYEH